MVLAAIVAGEHLARTSLCNLRSLPHRRVKHHSKQGLLSSPPTQNLKLGLALTQKSCVGHVHFMLFVSISFALGSQRKHRSQWNMGFSGVTLGWPYLAGGTQYKGLEGGPWRGSGGERGRSYR